MERKRTESKVNFYQKGPRMNSAVSRYPDRNFSQAERNKILEVLMSQERVLTLLYDKTFPPRPAS